MRRNTLSSALDSEDLKHKYAKKEKEVAELVEKLAQCREEYGRNLSGLMGEIREIREMNIELSREASENQAAVNNVWPHFIKLMMRECMMESCIWIGKKAEQMRRRYGALANERQVLIGDIARLKQK